jgi:uncharacterized coiled-coil protein SlyX
VSVDNESIAATAYESKIFALKSRVRELEAELFEARQAIFREGISAEEYKSERDRLKEENGNMDSMYQNRMLDLEAKLHKHYEAEISALANTITLGRQDFNKLRARHAALVEAASCIVKKYFDEKTILHMVDFEYLKAALAEVK